VSCAGLVSISGGPKIARMQLSTLAAKDEECGMTALIRRARETDAKHVALLLTELGYPSAEIDIQGRLHLSLSSCTACCLVAQSTGEIVGFVSAELVPYFPNGSIICRVTGLVVSPHHRSSGLGKRLLSDITDFARKHHCSGVEITSAEHRTEAHRFYERVGFSRTSFRFFRAL